MTNKFYDLNNRLYLFLYDMNKAHSLSKQEKMINLWKRLFSVTLLLQNNETLFNIYYPALL